MKEIKLEQGTLEWLQWRKSLLTASDASMLMGANPYLTAYKGWQRKVGLIPEQEETAPMRRGKTDEPIARDLFIKEYGINMTPCCVESEKYNFIGSSLDGLSDCGEFILEVKSQRPTPIKAMGIPEYHMMQMQHQLLSTDNSAIKAFYVSHWEGKNITIEVKPDYEWMVEYLIKAQDFWERIVFFDPPPMTNKDYKEMSHDGPWKSYANEYRKVCEQIKTLDEIKESYKKEIIKLCGEDSCLGGGIKVLKKVVKGRIDYDSIPDLYEINLEKYRKPPSCSWTIMLDQK